MSDYRLTQIQELEAKIQDTKLLLMDPEMSDLAQIELDDLESQKKALEESMQASDASSNEGDLDTRNVILEVKGAAGGDEAHLAPADRVVPQFCALGQPRRPPAARTDAEADDLWVRLVQHRTHPPS